ncbi:hypothetical protein evm_013785 [Chilo suppressalis]|nr:hypothetical protein evm_013785 [Chilo suppressalis]
MSHYFYLDVDLGEATSELAARRVVEEAARGLFGECGAAAIQADVLRVQRSRALYRVPARDLRRLRAALALARGPILVLAQAPSLQALL